MNTPDTPFMVRNFRRRADPGAHIENDFSPDLPEQTSFSHGTRMQQSNQEYEADFEEGTVIDGTGRSIAQPMEIFNPLNLPSHPRLDTTYPAPTFTFTQQNICPMEAPA